MSQLQMFQEDHGLTSHELRTKRAASPVVQAEIMSIFRDQPNAWLHSSDFTEIGIRHDIRSSLGHILFGMSLCELVKAKNIYFGDEHPSGNYLGFKTVYMLEAV